MKWLSERKVAETKRLLLEKDTRVKTILGAWRFRSATAFRETFRHHTGLCPKQWQQRQRQARSAK
jgi:AraC-like DNA-binding protein